jgi:hypothetical protein
MIIHDLYRRRPGGSMEVGRRCSASTHQRLELDLL